MRPRAVESYLLARRPAGRQSLVLSLEGPAANPTLRDAIGWQFRIAAREGTQVPVEVWITNELLALLQHDGYDVRDLVVRGAENLIADALLEGGDLRPGQHFVFGSADRRFVLRAAGVGDETYLSSEAPMEAGVSVVYDLTVRDGLWPGDYVELPGSAYVDVAVEARTEGTSRQVRTIRVSHDIVPAPRGQVIQAALDAYEARCRRLHVPLGSWIGRLGRRSTSQLTPDQQRLLELTYAARQAEGEWPLYTYIEARMDNEYNIDARDIVRNLPAGLLWGVGPGDVPHDRLTLTMAGLAELESAAAEIDLFTRVTRYLAQRRHDFVPSSATKPEFLTVTSDEVLRSFPADIGVSAELVLRLYDLLIQDPYLTNGGGKQVDGRWQVVVGPEARRYEDLASISDYLIRRRPDATRWRQQPRAAPPMPAAALTTETPQRADESGGQRSEEGPGEGVSFVSDVFALMPFSSEFDAVWAAIHEVSAELGLRCIRADSITLPGRITHQIVEAIRAASVIVADVTGNNPNVMFELGFADALGKPIVVLNQNVAEAPFDLRDWRQIQYTLRELDAMRSTLRQFLTRVVLDARRGNGETPLPERPVLAVRGGTIPSMPSETAVVRVRNVGTRPALGARVLVRNGQGTCFVGAPTDIGSGEELELGAVRRDRPPLGDLLPPRVTQGVVYRDAEGWIHLSTFVGQSRSWRAGMAPEEWVRAFEDIERSDGTSTGPPHA